MLVYGTFLIDTLLTVIFTMQAWNMLGGGWGQSSALDRITWQYGTVPLLSGAGRSFAHRCCTVH